jgi:predicted nucleic acid-binding protein
MTPRISFEAREGGIVLLDSNCLIYLVEGPERRGAAVRRFMDAAREAGARFSVSAIAWTELLDGAIRRKNQALATRYRGLLADSSFAVIEPVDVAVAEEAARIKASCGLGLSDCFHLGTALVIRADAILTNDEAWRSVEGLPPILIVDELAFGQD